jgi:predicted nucleotidyltransferase
MPVKDRALIETSIVTAIAEAIPGCLAIYRFGSWGTEAERPDSDLDLAILPPAPLDNVARWELAQRLASLAGRDVDLVDLLRASTVLKMQVVSQGTLLHDSGLSEVARFEDYVFSSYARLNEERRDILLDIRERGSVYGK